MHILSALIGKSMKEHQTAILLFSHTAADEAYVKTFVAEGGKKANIAVARKLIDHNISVAKQSKLPLFTCFSPDQSGSSFGERLANAFENVFSKGFDQVIAIGNDCVGISPALLLGARDQLTYNGLVLGPATDGGVYLIGLNKSAYQREKFIGLPWQKANLQQEWGSYGDEISSALIWLEYLQDIDNPTSLKYILQYSLRGTYSLISALLGIIGSLQAYKVNDSNNFILSPPVSKHLLRAPPC